MRDARVVDGADSVTMLLEVFDHGHVTPDVVGMTVRSDEMIDPGDAALLEVRNDLRAVLSPVARIDQERLVRPRDNQRRVGLANIEVMNREATVDG